MTAEQKAALIIARAALLSAEVAGMVAENQLRTRRDEALAYDESAFESAINAANLHEDSIIGFFQKPDTWMCEKCEKWFPEEQTRDSEGVCSVCLAVAS